MPSPEENAAGESAPHIDRQDSPDGASCRVLGLWTASELTARPAWEALTASLKAQGSDAGRTVAWDLRGIGQLDHLGAQVLWNHWGRQWPDQLEIGEPQRAVLERVAEFSVDRPAAPAPGFRQAFLKLGEGLLNVVHHFTDLVALVGRLMLNLGKLAKRPGEGPWRDLSGHLYHIGATALPITALVGFLIGVVLAYLISQQLKQFGADAFIVNILGISLIRELGPVLAAILIAGRSGSAITAQIGVMRVTEELDAMRVMGIAHSYRLVMPRALALAVVMPLISVWTTISALVGGMLAADLAMGITPSFFINALPAAVDAANLTLATAKSVVFGVLIALIGCHFGLRVKPNTESLGQGTTASVVTSITVVILVDALFAVLFKNVGT
ncbi:MAG: MlaE family ABC transporter permease [Polaromonas sp.]|uniref:MlaE family ABC transporter permease n=1 Tax=Polaromonas sp. TaxID=1869339 RepID=UPI0040367AB7